MLHLVLAVSPLDPFVAFMWWIVQGINVAIHNYGVSLIILALLIRLAFWGLNVKQFKAMLAMQRIAPRLKQLQTKYKGDQQRLQQETMALYREAGVNPLAGCLPMVVQLPILYSVYWVVVLNATLKGRKGVSLDMCQSHAPAWFASFPLHAQLHAMCFNSPFLWIGSGLAAHYPAFIATTLAKPDVLLLALYAISMYFSMRYASAPSTDEQQAQVQKMMAIFLPIMIGYMGWRAQWPSAMILY
ncbi:MAG TPA: YidC/Oxa1 family membrane protein insertase, partial [Polyangiales bacterium]|nr:YidC/Oxa1 family membrane protein insertase [Polyangiales bacterium]